MGNQVEVNVTMDDRKTIRFNVRDEDVYEIMRKYAIPQTDKSQETDALGYLYTRL